MRKFGKKYVEASKKVEKNTLYSATDAVKLVKETNVTKFDSTIDVAIKLNVDPKKQIKCFVDHLYYQTEVENLKRF